MRTRYLQPSMESRTASSLKELLEEFCGVLPRISPAAEISHRNPLAQPVRVALALSIRRFGAKVPPGRSSSFCQCGSGACHDAWSSGRRVETPDVLLVLSRINR